MSPIFKHSSFQKYRMEVIARWPESAEKHVAVKSAGAALDRELASEMESARRRH